MVVCLNNESDWFLPHDWFVSVYAAHPLVSGSTKVCP